MPPPFPLTPTSSDGDPFCTQEFCDDGLTDGNTFEYVSGSSFSFVFIYNRVRQDPVVRHCVYGDVMGSANTTRNIQQDTSFNVYGVKYSFDTVTANITCDPVGTPAFAAWAEVYIRVISGGPWVLYRLSETPTGSYGGGGVSYTVGNIVTTGEAVSLTVDGSPIALPYSGNFESFEYTAPEATELPTAPGIPIYFQPQVAPSYHFPLTSVAATGDPFCTDAFCDDAPYLGYDVDNPFVLPCTFGRFNAVVQRKQQKGYQCLSGEPLGFGPGDIVADLVRYDTVCEMWLSSSCGGINIGCGAAAVLPIQIVRFAGQYFWRNNFGTVSSSSFYGDNYEIAPYAWGGVASIRTEAILSVTFTPTDTAFNEIGPPVTITSGPRNYLTIPPIVL